MAQFSTWKSVYSTITSPGYFLSIHSFGISLTVYLIVCHCISILSISLYLCMFIFIWLTIYKSICISLSIWLSICLSIYNSLSIPVSRYHNSKVNHPIIITTEDNSNNIFANVMDISFDCGENNSSNITILKQNIFNS